MEQLEAEYSFLTPTWKLPAVATPSMYGQKKLVRGNTDLVKKNATKPISLHRTFSFRDNLEKHNAQRRLHSTGVD